MIGKGTLNSPSASFKSVAQRFEDKENIHHGQPILRSNSEITSFAPDVFQNNTTFNPLLYNPTVQSYTFGGSSIYQDDMRPPQSSFMGDFRPVMITPRMQGQGDFQKHIAQHGPDLGFRM
jgi:hypothetical protein